MLARERDHAVSTAVVAVHANEALTGHPAGDEITKRGHHESGNGVAGFARVRDERVQFFLDHTANEVLGSIARNVGWRSVLAVRPQGGLRHAPLSHDRRPRGDDTDVMKWALPAPYGTRLHTRTSPLSPRQHTRALPQPRTRRRPGRLRRPWPDHRPAVRFPAIPPRAPPRPALRAIPRRQFEYLSRPDRRAPKIWK